MERIANCNLFFFFNDTATTEIYTLSLHDALPISAKTAEPPARGYLVTSSAYEAAVSSAIPRATSSGSQNIDRKSTRLNSSHANISYAVFCLKKKKYN